MSLELEQIHEDMLNAIHDRYQKTLGFPAYDFTRAFALAVLSLVLFLIYWIVHLVRGKTLEARLDAEYGPKPRPRR